MKLNTLSLAVAAALGSLAFGPAFAITADQYGTGSDTQNFYISGATAQDAGIVNTARSLCSSVSGTGSMTWYSISNNNVYYCTPDTGTGAGQITLPSGKTKMAIYKYSVGGSGNGVAPVNNASALKFMDLTKLDTPAELTAAGCTSATVNPGDSLPSYQKFTCTGSSTLMTSDATPILGLSDVEPAFFSNAVGNLSTTPVSSLIFGVPVSKNVRDRLQAVQGLGAACVGLDTEACMPSLSSAQITSMFTSAGQSWTGLNLDMSSTLTVSGATAAQNALIVPLLDDTVYVARRVNSSGTQKTFEALVAKTPNGEPYKSCVTGVDPFVAPDNAVGLTTGDADTLCNSATPPIVFGGSGGGNVRACMVNHHAQGRGAIGILTTEDKAGTANWRFVKVDGVAPTQANVAAGTYKLYTENTLNYKAASVTAANGYLGLVNRMKSDFANPTIITLINGTVQPFGTSGLMALLSLQTTSPNNVPNFTGSNSVNPWTKLVGGTTSNNCQMPKQFF